MATICVAGLMSANNGKMEHQKMVVRENVKSKLANTVEQVCYQTNTHTTCGPIIENSGYCYTPGDAKSIQAAHECAKKEALLAEIEACGKSYNNGLGKDNKIQ